MTVRFGFAGALLAICAAFLVAAAAAPADPGNVKVLRTIPFSGDAASQKIQDECELQNKVPHFLDTYSDRVELVDGPLGKSGRTLELKITGVHAPGGGAFSGAKWMKVEGVLRENGREIGNFEATRYSGGGVWGAYKGTCAIVGRCAKTIGKDIAQWLENPQKDSKLGNS
ncbi:MAG TPA: hypothetical protein VIY27_13475 [Myxococcota bacterium]